MWFKTVTTTLSKVILANTGQALPGIPGAGSGRISDWKEVPSGGEAPFEFTSGEKQRHKVSSWDGDLLEKCQLMSWNITVRFHRISRVLCAETTFSKQGIIHPSHPIPSHPIHSSTPSYPFIHPINFSTHFFLKKLVHADLIWLLHKLQKINPFNRPGCNLSS